ncbi:phenylalanine--tRNA ligase subunit beta [Candidatus Woesearchaeota archaeon]|nr:phenylalanine--tRNA ligase subunit beta [Candidatus Woesearchaeota archaeon]
MVILDTSLIELNKHVKRNLTKKQLDDILFNLGMELESSEGNEIKVEITPDRPDLLSTQGLARALRAYLGIHKGLIKYKIKKSGIKINVVKSVDIVRPFTVAAVVKNLKFDYEKLKEIINFQEKIHNTFARKRKKVAIGIYPLENIKPPIKYLAKYPEDIKFTPLDFKKEMTGKEILEKHPKGMEYAHLLEDHKKYPVFIDANNKILSMPPIINAEGLGKVTEKTKDVFIECSGHDLNSLNQVLNLVATTLADMNGEIYAVDINYGNKKITTPDLNPEKREIKVDYANKILGLNLKPKEISILLEKMNYGISSVSKDKISILVPKYRVDIWHDIDVVDDIVRAYGVNNMKLSFKPVSSIAETLPENDFIEKLRESIIGLGFVEAFTFALTSKDDQFKKMNTRPCPYVELGSTKEATINMVRNWLLPELMKFIVNNRSKPYPQRIFEINDVVVPDNKEEVKSRNVIKLSCLIAHEKANFTEIKQVLDYLSQVLNINFNIKELKHDSFIEGRCASILINNKEIGFLGEIHPKVLDNFQLAVPVSALELDLEEVFNYLK